MFNFIVDKVAGWIGAGVEPESVATDNRKQKSKRRDQKVAHPNPSVLNPTESKTVDITDEPSLEFDLEANSDGGIATFIPAKTFSRSIPGYVFHKGPQGLGYYSDPVPPIQESTTPVADEKPANKDSSKSDLLGTGGFGGFKSGWLNNTKKTSEQDTGTKATEHSTSSKPTTPTKPTSAASKTLVPPTSATTTAPTPKEGSTKKKRREVEWVMPGMSDKELSTALAKTQEDLEQVRIKTAAEQTSPSPSPPQATKQKVMVKPQDLIVEKNTSNEVELSWKYGQSKDIKFILELKQQDDTANIAEYKEVYVGQRRRFTIQHKHLMPVVAINLRVCAVNQDGVCSEWVVCGTFYQQQRCLAGSGGYGPNKTYSWVQRLEEVDINVALDKTRTHSGKDFSVTFSPKALTIKSVLDGKMIIDGKLHDKVEIDDCFWELETDCGKQVLTIQLRKKAPPHAMLGLTSPSQFWPRIIVGHPQIDSAEFKASLPVEVTQSDGKPMKQKRPYGRQAERAGFSPYGMDCNATPDAPYDGYRGVST